MNEGRHAIDEHASLDPHESRLAELLSDLTDRVAAGDSVDLETEVDHHPEFADDLRHILASL